MATIKAVAALAGVSPAAISKYLKTPERMRQETREKIEAAIRELDYRPNLLAQSLRTGRTNLIAVAFPGIVNPSNGTLFDILHFVCKKRGLIPVLLNVRLDSDLPEAIDFLNSGMVDALFCVNAAPFVHTVKLPIVEYSPMGCTFTTHCIRLDLKAGIFALCSHLERQGVRSLAYLGYDGEIDISTKLQCFRDYCSQHELQLGYVGLHRDEVPYYSLEDGYVQCNKLLETCKTLPDAIFCCSDIFSSGVIRCLSEHHIRIPDDILVASHDDTFLSQTSTPPLTSIQEPYAMVAETAIDMVCQLLSGGDPEPITVQTTLEPRGSTMRR